MRQRADVRHEIVRVHQADNPHLIDGVATDYDGGQGDGVAVSEPSERGRATSDEDNEREEQYEWCSGR